MGLRSTKNSKNGITPGQIVLGYDMSSKIKINRMDLHKQINSNKSLHNQRVKRNFDRRVQKSKSFHNSNYAPNLPFKDKQQPLFKEKQPRRNHKYPGRFQDYELF